MDIRHILVMVVVFVAGFYVAKKWPALFASIPVIGPVLS